MRQVVPPTVIYQLPLALYRSSLELSPLDHSHLFAMYTPPLTRVCAERYGRRQPLCRDSL